MQLVTLFCLLVAVASEPVVKSWTLNELSMALETNSADPITRPYLEDALNKIMLDLFTGKNANSIYAAIPSPKNSAYWTLGELSEAIANPSTESWKRAALVSARTTLLRLQEAGKPRETIPVMIPALDVSLWTQDDVSQAIKDTSTNAALIPYLERASNEFKQAIASGTKREKTGMVTSVGLIKLKTGQPRLLPAPKVSEPARSV